MKKIISFISTGVLLYLLLIFPASIDAKRITPEDIVNSKREAYEETVKNYSSTNRKKLEELSGKIVFINKKRTDELEIIMNTQARILDEYERRSKGRNSGGIEKARYFLTYAHEAVAYQAAKIYIFNLSTESNIKQDAAATLLQFQAELSSARLKVINSQKILQNAIKDI